MATTTARNTGASARTVIVRVWRGIRGWRRRLIITCAFVLFAPVPAILVCAVVQPPITAVIMHRTIQRLVQGKRPIVPRHRTVTRAALSPNLRRAVLASEDQRFYLHHGIDFAEMQAALDRRRAGGRLRGASTLTQQVAKNLFLWNGRSFVRKGLELYLALWLEVLLSKERILDLYLNLAEWGDGVFGAEAAAQTHFHKRASQLSREESARLAAILPSPQRWSPMGAIATRRATLILAEMQHAVPRPEDLTRGR